VTAFGYPGDAMSSTDLLALLRKKSFAKAYELARKAPRTVNEPETGDASDTPFQWACRFGDKATMREFLALGGDVAKPAADDGRVPLELVADGSPYATAAHVEARTEMAAALLEAKAPLGPEALELACNLGAGKARALVALLIAAGAKGDFVSGGSTILHLACTYDLPEALEYGLSSSVDVNAAIDASAFDGGSTALHVAVKKRRTAMVERLVAAGARADLADKRGATAHSLATAALRKVLEGKPAAAAPAPKRAKDPAAILEQLWKAPSDRETLTVYADWLMENGQASRGEYIALRLLEKPTAAQIKRATQLREKDRGKWLGDARKLVSEWVDSERTPGFVAQATVSVERLIEHFEALRALGPEVVLRVTPIKTRLLTKKLAALPLGRLPGLSLYNTLGTYGMNRDWLDDTSLGILGPSLVGLRTLVLAPAVQAKEGEHFTPRAIEALRPAGATLEALTLDFTDGTPPRALLDAVTPAVFPKVRELAVVGLGAPQRKGLRAAWGDRATFVG